MIDFIKAYIKHIDQLYQTGVTTEHSFRGDLQRLLEDTTGYKVINEQKRIDCGAPDLALYKKDVPYAYFEAKDIEGGDLDGRNKNKKQFDRYKAALGTIVFTDYLDFHLYEDGILQTRAELAYIEKGHIVLNENALPRFISILEHLIALHPQKITSSKKLAILMANKAKLIAEAVMLELKSDEEQTGSLYMQLKAFKDVLNKDIDESRFADLYAQTIAYGFFAARIHDDSPNNFTIKEAADLIPETNPFLRQLFQNLAAYNVNKSIAWIVDDLVTIFAATDVKKLRKNFETEYQKRDPMIHFYEDFLACYNPEAKKKYGVFYTPQPVVEFIVRAVDDILKSDFGLAEGLADTSKVDTPVENGISQHRVQILDPATGTGTFLAEVVSRIKERQQPGIWPKYVREHLLPRVYGFEYMIAPYTIAHLKLDMLMNLSTADKEQLTNEDRVNIYLTNSLIKDDIKPKYIFAQEIANEANKANKIKHSAPVMVMLGNPPYAVSSNNKGDDFKWIETLLKDYKKGLNEKKLNLDDDYIKFIRLAQYYVERTGEGIVAYISNNSFIDGVTHRQMRRELMRCFDDIYILDLHGNYRKNEISPDGSEDENVFNIMQGVSINIFVKKKDSANKPAEIHHYDLFGARDEKYKFLSKNTIQTIPWHLVQPIEPNLFFVPKDFSFVEEYKKGFRISDFLSKNNSGVKTDRDLLFYDIEIENLRKRIKYLLGGNIDDSFREKYTVKDSSSYNLTDRIKKAAYNESYITLCQYRPLDFQYIYYDPKIISRPGEKIFRNIINKKNLALLTTRNISSKVDFQHVFVSENVTDLHSVSDQTYVFPLYLYPEDGELDLDTECKPNMDENIWRTIENWVKYGQAFKPLTTNEQNGLLGFDAAPEEPHFLTPEDIFDYIYGVLHSPHYREKYKEFLKVDFPRIPYPKNKEEFEHYKECGHQLRELHLMHNVPDDLYSYDIQGSDLVEQPHWRDNRVFINNNQYFDKVPEAAWNMYIGGYQPAQKWLKDRKGRKLEFDDIEHYRKIIAVLMETARIMKQIDDPNAQVEELKHKVQDLEYQLQAVQSASEVKIVGSNVTFIDNSTNYNIKK